MLTTLCVNISCLETMKGVELHVQATVAMYLPYSRKPNVLEFLAAQAPRGYLLGSLAIFALGEVVGLTPIETSSNLSTLKVTR